LRCRPQALCAAVRRVLALSQTPAQPVFFSLFCALLLTDAQVPRARQMRFSRRAPDLADWADKPVPVVTSATGAVLEVAVACRREVVSVTNGGRTTLRDRGPAGASVHTETARDLQHISKSEIQPGPLVHPTTTGRTQHPALSELAPVPDEALEEPACDSSAVDLPGNGTVPSRRKHLPTGWADDMIVVADAFGITTNSGVDSWSEGRPLGAGPQRPTSIRLETPPVQQHRTAQLRDFGDNWGSAIPVEIDAFFGGNPGQLPLSSPAFPLMYADHRP